MSARSILLPLVLGCSFACTSAPPEGEVLQGGLTITRHDSVELIGQFVDGSSTMRFRAQAPADDRAVLELIVNGKVLGYEGLAATDQHDGWYRVTIDQVFEERDVAVAQAALEALVSELGTDTTAMALYEASVPKLAYFVANQAPGVAVGSLFHREYSVSTPLWSLNDDGRVCIKKTTTVAASYDNQAGAATTTNVVVGSNWGTSACGSANYACMGRCGAGCSGFGGGWTLDCLEHDACSHDLCASGGGSDRNCGDEYNHASSDIFSSCSGS